MVDANLKSFTKNNQEPHSNDTKQTGFESVILLVAILKKQVLASIMFQRIQKLTFFSKSLSLKVNLKGLM